MTTSSQTYINVQGNLVEASLQPPYPRLQEAFRMGNDSRSIVIDITAARARAKNLLREERKNHFAINRDEWDKAQMLGDQTKIDAVKARAQYLRDITADPRIEDAKNAEELLNAVDTIISEMRAV